MTEKLFIELSELEQVEAIALGGSRSGQNYDEKSDYDVYVYCSSAINEETRNNILKKYCSNMEIGNHYWEYEDNCTLNNGVDIDIIYRTPDDFYREVADVVENYHAHNGYTTCMWHNLINCKVIYDKNGSLLQAKKRFDVPYPNILRENIIKRNMNLLCDTLPSYSHQIEKAVARNDSISIIHRITAFLESYFDVILAVNRQTHFGEKRLIELCMKYCSVLPCDFETNLNQLFRDLSSDKERIVYDISVILAELKKILI